MIKKRLLRFILDYQEFLKKEREKSLVKEKHGCEVACFEKGTTVAKNG